MAAGDPQYLAGLKRMAYWLGKKFPVGPQSMAEGAELCRALLQHRLHTTLGRLSRSGDDPEQIVREYRQASDELAGVSAPARFYLSVKPPALGFDPERVEAIAATALANGHGVHFDSHKFSQTDATLLLLEGLLRRNLPFGGDPAGWRFSLTVPSRWKRSIADARWAAEHGVRVRLVKGDFPAGRSLEVDPHQGFRDLVESLAGVVPELALATHDCALARECVARCRKAGCGVQLELFFGRPASDMLQLWRETGVPLGFYVPYGETLSIYLVRDLIGNPRKLFRHDAFELLGGVQRKLDRITRVL